MLTSLYGQYETNRNNSMHLKIDCIKKAEHIAQPLLTTEHFYYSVVLINSQVTEASILVALSSPITISTA